METIGMQFISKSAFGGIPFFICLRFRICSSCWTHRRHPKIPILTDSDKRVYATPRHRIAMSLLIFIDEETQIIDELLNVCSRQGLDMEPKKSSAGVLPLTRLHRERKCQPIIID